MPIYKILKAITTQPPGRTKQFAEPGAPTLEPADTAPDAQQVHCAVWADGSSFLLGLDVCGPALRVNLLTPKMYLALLCPCSLRSDGCSSPAHGLQGGLCQEPWCQELSGCLYITLVISGGSFWTFAHSTLLRQEKGYKTRGPVSRCHLGENLSGLQVPPTR